MLEELSEWQARYINIHCHDLLAALLENINEITGKNYQSLSEIPQEDCIDLLFGLWVATIVDWEQIAAELLDPIRAQVIVKEEPK